MLKEIRLVDLFGTPDVAQCLRMSTCALDRVTVIWIRAIVYAFKMRPQSGLSSPLPLGKRGGERYLKSIHKIHAGSRHCVRFFCGALCSDQPTVVHSVI